jgi:hypothetical protein
MSDVEGLIFHVDGAHSESVVDDLHLYRILSNDLAKRAVGVGGEGFGFDLQNVGHGRVPSRCLWQMVVETSFCRICKVIDLTVARQLTITLTVTQHYHLAGARQCGPGELQRRLAYGPHRRCFLNKLHEEPRMLRKVIVHGEHNRRL